MSGDGYHPEDQQQQYAQVINPIVFRTCRVSPHQAYHNVVHPYTVARHKGVEAIGKITEGLNTPVQWHHPFPFVSVAVQGLENSTRAGVYLAVGIEEADGLPEIFQVDVGKVFVDFLEGLVIDPVTGQNLPFDHPVMAEPAITVPGHQWLVFRRVFSMVDFLEHGHVIMVNIQINKLVRPIVSLARGLLVADNVLLRPVFERMSHFYNFSASRRGSFASSIECFIKKNATMKKIIAFTEIPAANFERAVSFYQRILNQKLEIAESPEEKMACFPSGEGAISYAADFKPSSGGVLVSLNTGHPIDEAIRLVESHGGTILTPKTKIEVEGQGYFAIFADTEGNRIGLYGDS